MRCVALAFVVLLVSACGPTLNGSEWDGTSRFCADPVNDTKPFIIRVDDRGFASIVTDLGWPEITETIVCDGSQTPIEEDALDFASTFVCPDFEISYQVDIQDDAVVVGTDGALVQGEVSFLRNDGNADSCGLVARRRRDDP